MPSLKTGSHAIWPRPSCPDREFYLLSLYGFALQYDIINSISSMPFDPTPEQSRLLGHDPHAHGVLLAGPGTGKSAVMVAYIEKLANMEHPPRVRLLTFTRAATSELALRVSEHPTLAAQRPSTVHSFAISVLMQNPGAANFPQPLRMADDWEHKNLVRPTLARRARVRVRVLDVLLRELEANW
jgi:superfamily I DNA/RNA helicase